MKEDYFKVIQNIQSFILIDLKTTGVLAYSQDPPTGFNKILKL